MLTEMEIVRKACTEWSEFKAENQVKKQETERIPRMIWWESWKPPEVRGMKLNVCSLCDHTFKRAGLGIVARNDQGHLVQAWTVVKQEIDNPIVAELEAVRAALLEALQNCWRKVEVQVEIKALAESLQHSIILVLEATAIAEDFFVVLNV